jgi:hypothetical protein
LRVIEGKLAKVASERGVILSDVKHAIGVSRQRARDALPGRWQNVIQKGDQARIERTLRALEKCKSMGQDLEKSGAAVRDQLRAGQRKIERLGVLVDERKRSVESARENNLAASEIEARAVMQSICIDQDDRAGSGPSYRSEVDRISIATVADRMLPAPSGGSTDPAPGREIAIGPARPHDVPPADTDYRPRPLPPTPRGEIEGAHFNSKGGVAELNFSYRTGDGQSLQVAISQAANRVFVNLHASANQDRYRLISQRKAITEALRDAGIPISQITFRRVR